MAKDEIVLAVLETTTPETKIEIRIDYDKGGMNFFQGVVMQRGYYISVVPFQQGEKCRFVRAFSGTTVFLEPAQRLSAKRLAERAEQIGKNMQTHEPLQKAIAHVLQKNNLTLKEASHAASPQG